ncbi:hypothetical protein Cni_G17215 [Canna indica]|uniref:HMA domain-containing protein n=1 Tax=Canna indica TaxID=4628 RepID=A0AAQ3KM13_9LILI|nr:hypothetical protein Cni_G17215 [Canna indica]
MAPSLFRETKGTNYFSCASPSSAAICSSIHHTSIIQPISARKEIDRHHAAHLKDRSRRPATTHLNPKSELRRSTKSSSTKQADLVSPAGSSRHLLVDSSRYRFLEDSSTPFYDVIPAPVPRLLAIEAPRSQHCARSSERAVLRPSSSTRTQDQVVVLRVSLHCKGCEAKVRRHIAKMQGVRSFSVDLATKKVTVSGDVTPLGVLNSISKVKHAQFWQSPPRASASF